MLASLSSLAQLLLFLVSTLALVCFVCECSGVCDLQVILVFAYKSKI